MTIAIFCDKKLLFTTKDIIPRKGETIAYKFSLYVVNEIRYVFYSNCDLKYVQINTNPIASD